MYGYVIRYIDMEHQRQRITCACVYDTVQEASHACVNEINSNRGTEIRECICYSIVDHQDNEIDWV